MHDLEAAGKVFIYLLFLPLKSKLEQSFIEINFMKVDLPLNTSSSFHSKYLLQLKGMLALAEEIMYVLCVEEH